MTAFPKPAPKERVRFGSTRRKPPRRLDDPSKSDREYLAHLHDEQDCVGRRHFPDHRCRRGFHASHFRNHTGASLKESDHLAIKMCGDLHLQQWEAYAGEFKGWTQDERKAWFMDRVRESVADFLAEHPERRAQFEAEGLA